MNRLNTNKSKSSDDIDFNSAFNQAMSYNQTHKHNMTITHFQTGGNTFNYLQNASNNNLRYHKQLDQIGGANTNNHVDMKIPGVIGNARIKPTLQNQFAFGQGNERNFKTNFRVFPVQLEDKC
jgi:hypothetical protein